MLSLLQSRPARGAPHHAASRTPPVITSAEACPRGHGLMDLHYANWERFCRYHVGDWYGLWTPFTADGVALAYANWERFCRYHVGDWYGLWTPFTADGVALAP